MNKGFTLVELLISMAILMVIFAISTIAFSGIIPSTSQGTTYDSLISDLRLQQTQAMTTNSYFGIYFGTTSYTLFKGAVYSSSDSSNYVVSLDPTINLTSILFPGNEVVFLPGSGDIQGYVAGSNGVTISNMQTGKATPVKINIHGATY